MELIFFSLSLLGFSAFSMFFKGLSCSDLRDVRDSYGFNQNVNKIKQRTVNLDLNLTPLVYGITQNHRRAVRSLAVFCVKLQQRCTSSWRGPCCQSRG